MKQSVLDTLEQGLELLDGLSQQDYEAQLPLAYNASIGGHYRHVLEHFSMLLENYQKGVLNYDLRSRDCGIEGCLSTATEATRSMMEQWNNLDPSIATHAMTILGKTSTKSDQSMEVSSSFGRETAYSIAHAHHHFAIIGIMCKLIEKPVCKNFGIAPSTVAHMQQKNKQAVAT